MDLGELSDGGEIKKWTSKQNDPKVSADMLLVRDAYLDKLY